MLALREFSPTDDIELISWLRTPEELFYFTGPMLEWPLDSGQLDAVRADPNQLAWTVVTDTGEPAGHIELSLVGGAIARLVRVLIAPLHRGNGYSTEMVTAAMTEARALGINRLHLNVVEDNERAIALYEKLGFAHTGRLPDRHS